MPKYKISYEVEGTLEKDLNFDGYRGVRVAHTDIYARFPVSAEIEEVKPEFEPGWYRERFNDGRLGPWMYWVTHMDEVSTTYTQYVGIPHSEYEWVGGSYTKLDEPYTSTNRFNLEWVRVDFPNE